MDGYSPITHIWYGTLSNKHYIRNNTQRVVLITILSLRVYCSLFHLAKASVNSNISGNMVYFDQNIILLSLFHIFYCVCSYF